MTAPLAQDCDAVAAKAAKGVRVIVGDCRDVLRTLPDESVNCVVTSPPYFGLRDYGCDGQIGLEATPDAFVSELVSVFQEVRRVLRDDGTLWLNLGDSYAGGGGHCPTAPSSTYSKSGKYGEALKSGGIKPQGTIKQKDLIGIPWRVAFALQADGWYLRQDIIWSKPNPMPESVQDRCTKSHEYVFLLSKSPRYHYDADAIAEPVTASTVARLAQDVEAQEGSLRVPGKTNGTMKAVGGRPGGKKPDQFDKFVSGAGRSGVGEGLDTRNARSVWNIATQPFSEAHFATFPPELAERCIKAGCPVGGTVLDPFFGAGTTGLVADRLQRDCIGIELNPAYAEIARNRIHRDAPLFAELPA